MSNEKWKREESEHLFNIGIVLSFIGGVIWIPGIILSISTGKIFFTLVAIIGVITQCLGISLCIISAKKAYEKWKKNNERERKN